MVYTIYKTINLLNGKFYIGKHQTENPEDDYLGSGKALREAIKVHGISNFKKEILYIFDTEDEMNRKEQEIITEEFISSSLNYNEAVGGEGGAHFKGKIHSIETRKRIREKMRGRSLSEEAKKKISDSNRKRTLSIETREKLSRRTKERFNRMTETEKTTFR